VVGATLKTSLGVVKPPQCPRGWSQPPPKGKKKKKKKKRKEKWVKMGFGFLGVAEPPPCPRGAWGWPNHPQTRRGGGSSHPRFSSFLFIFFDFHLSLKNNNNNGQNNVVLGWVDVVVLESRVKLTFSL
jgi:hypothetical protein